MIEPREKILASACDLYLKDGLEGFSMRKLARSLGVTAPALYRHYESKERVLLAVVGEAYRHLIQYLHRALEGRTPQDRFRLAGDAYLEFALGHPRYYEVLFMGVELLRMGPSDEVAAQGCAVGQFWNDRVRECVEAGLLREGDAEGIGLSLWSHGHGLISLYLKGMLNVSEEQVRAMYRDSCIRVFRGLGTPQYAAWLESERAGRQANLNGSGRGGATWS